MRGGSCRPGPQEAFLPALMVIVEPDGRHMQHASADLPCLLVQQRQAGRRWRGRDAADDAMARTAKVGHAGRAVVDHRVHPARTFVTAQRRQAGMAAGEDVDIGTAELVQQGCLCLGVVQPVLSKVPTGQRLRIAMHDADAGAPDQRQRMHRQGTQQHALQRLGQRRFAQLFQYLVGAFDLGIRHVVGIAAATAEAGIVGRQFGFDIAAQRDMAQHAAVDVGKNCGVGVEPVKVAIEDQRGGRFYGGDALHRVQCFRIAVQAADHIQRVCRKIRRAPEYCGTIAITGRAAAAGANAHASAPPQLLPAPAVQPQQCSATATGLPCRSRLSMSDRCMRPTPSCRIGMPSIWLKSQSYR